MKKDYYEVLAVERTADEATIKKAYRRLAMECHPDRNPSPEAEERFKEASEAYSVLSDAQKRQTYDRFGHDGLRSSGFSGFSGAGVEDIFSSFGDIFGDLFGFGRARRPGQSRGRDLHAELAVDFEEAVFGCVKELTVEQLVHCDDCHGSGAGAGSETVRCRTCQGRGQVLHGQGLFLVGTTCPDCAGAGSSQSAPCRSCRGDGRTRARRTVNVKVPAGFDDGISLRYPGEGEAGRFGGPSGDFYVQVRVKPHATLKREGDDLIAELPLSITQAALGADLEVKGIEGTEEVTVEPGTQPGHVITLRKKGVPRLRGGGRGDLHIVCKVEIPTQLNNKQKKLLEELQESFEPSKDETGKGRPEKKRRLFS